MISLAIFWFKLPILVKLFAIFILFYIVIILTIQLYSVLETVWIKWDEAREEKMLAKYGDSLDELLHCVESDLPYSKQQVHDYVDLSNKNKYFARIFFKKLTSKIRSCTENQTDYASDSRKRLVSFVKQWEVYKIVINHQKTFGEYNTLSILGILRDQRALPYFKKSEAIAFKRKSILLGYYVMLGYARLGDNTSLKSVFDRIVDNLEVSSEHMYAGLLKSCEEDVRDWQEDALFNGNINHQLIAMMYFYEIDENKYIDFAKQQLAMMSKLENPTTKEMDYQTILNKYCDKWINESRKGV